jgi:2-polyprenyl-6-methoxyphenol hydroxylase-like FAD-dependent oxidoreductase
MRDGGTTDRGTTASGTTDGGTTDRGTTGSGTTDGGTTDRGLDTDVLIVGAGPAGLMLACELGLAGVRATVIEQHPRPPGFCRGFNLNARSLDLLDRRGIADRFLAAGPTVPAITFAGLNRPLDLSTMDTSHPYVLGIAQTRVEELLEERAGELGVPVLRGRRLTGLHQDAGAVTAVLDGPGPGRLRAGYLAGCDGGRSTVRKLAGIAFPGTAASRYTLLGDVVLADPAALPFGPTATGHGSVFVIPRPGYVRIITGEPEPPADRDSPVTLPYLQAAVDRALGRHVELTEPRWLTRFGDAARQAERYVAGRVLLAGDAAHIHPPAGAIGVNVAVDDAMNLGWKLAAAVRGWAPATLLDSYHSERHAAGARLLRDTRAQTLLGRRDEQWEPVRELLADVADVPAATKYLAERVTGVGTRYPMPTLDGGSTHPWLGRMAPDLHLTAAATDAGATATATTATGRAAVATDAAATTGSAAAGSAATTTVARLLSSGRAVLLDLADRPRLRAEAAAWGSRLTVHTGRCAQCPDVSAMLIRPDGHVAWIAGTSEGTGSAGTDEGTSSEAGTLSSLRHALGTWLGTPAGPGPHTHPTG